MKSEQSPTVMKTFFKRLFCKHSVQSFVRNIHGDEINLLNARSIYRCVICGKYIYKNTLHL